MGLIHGLLAAFFPPSALDLSDVSAGENVLVRGQVVPRDLIESPLTGDRCVYYQYTVEEWRAPRSGALGGDGFWHLVQRDEAIAEFYLQSGGHRAIVAPHSSNVERARGLPVGQIDLGGILDRRAQQLIIAPGDTIEVHAQVEAVDDLFDEGRDYRQSPTRLMLSAPTGSTIRIRLVERAHRRAPGRVA